MKILLSLITFLLLTTPSWATTYYIRVNGGTSAQCSGLVNNDYDGGAHGTDCALNHPNWTFPPRGESTAKKAVTGDTVVIGTGSYRIGCQNSGTCKDSTVNISAAYCNTSAPGDCIMSDGSASLVGIPANVTVIGCSTTGCGCTHSWDTTKKMWSTSCTTTRPQLWGAGKIGYILHLDSGSTGVTVQDLELTDHSGCGYRVGTPSCDETSASLAAQQGMSISGASNFTLKNLWVHGLGSGAITGHTTGGAVFDGVNIDKNANQGWNADDGTGTTGSVTWRNHWHITFSGCIEAYPLTGDTANTRTDVVYCTDQNSAGYGDGIGTADGTNGDWSFTDGECSYNVQDCIDLLHSAFAGGSLYAFRVRGYGNNGATYKSSLIDNVIENSVFIGNCSYFNKSGISKNASWADCRANGAVVSVVSQNGVSLKIKNSTIWGEGGVIVDYGQLGGANTCTGSEVFNFDNNIFYGALDHGGSGTQADAFYCSGSDGAGGGNCCTTYYPNVIWKNSVVYNAKHNPSGTNMSYTDPHVAQGDHIDDAVNIDVMDFNLTVNSTNSIGLADKTVTLVGTSDDVNNYSRGTLWDIGGFEYGSTPSGGGSSTTGSSVYNIKLQGSIKFQ